MVGRESGAASPQASSRDRGHCASTGQGFEPRDLEFDRSHVGCGPDKSLPERMFRSLLNSSHEREGFIVIHLSDGLDAHEFGPGLGQRPGLVERHSLDRRQVLEHLTSLDQNADLRRATDCCHHARRHRDHESARAGNDEQREPPIEPLVERSSGQRRDNGHQDGGEKDDRGVDPGEAVDKSLRWRAASLSVGNQACYLCKSRVLGSRR